MAVLIDPRFNGPPGSGNGGCVAGLAAGLFPVEAFCDGVEVTLRSPPPLGRPLTEVHDGEVLRLLDGERLIVEVRAAPFSIELPSPVSLEDAETASRSYAGFTRHEFPSCYVCGPNRPDGDGLKIFPGWVPGRKLVAAPWRPNGEQVDADGRPRREFLWAALDCAGGWAVDEFRIASPLLARLQAKRLAEPPAREPLVVLGWPQRAEGRKLWAGTALYTVRGEPVACASALWIKPPNAPPGP